MGATNDEAPGRTVQRVNSEPAETLLGVFGYLLGARRLGGAATLFSSAAVLGWMLT